jgi:Gram-negative bacterial TonB protein C-terminal
MKRVLRIAAGLVLFSLVVLCVAVPANAQGAQQFIPPDVLYASEVPYSDSTAAAGVVTLAVNLDGGGNIINAQVLRDVPTLTSPALVAVHGWTYAAASFNGKRVPATLLVNVVFDPPFLQLQNVTLTPAQAFQPPDPKATPYAPPQLLAATYPPYPSGGLVGGAVVLEVVVGSAGAIGKVTVIRAVPTLTAAAIPALKAWKFAAAVYEHTPVAAKVVVAMVYRKPVMPEQ